MKELKLPVNRDIYFHHFLASQGPFGWTHKERLRYIWVNFEINL